MGYQSNRQLDYANETMVAALMATSKVFFSRSHGEKTQIQLNNYYYFTIDTLSDCVDDAMSRCELVLYGACLTGEGRDGAENLVNATVDAGVQSVVGFDSEINFQVANFWAEEFFGALKLGETVEDACYFADECMEERIANDGQGEIEDISFTEYAWYIGGDKYAAFG